MAERKSVNRYIPPNFDPDAISERSTSVKMKPSTGVTGLVGSTKPQRTVRLMMPFTVRCTTCGEYVYKGRKFNARKETCWGETYLGVQIFRFYVRCTQCAAEIIFRTDPQNADYALEAGGTRNAEPWRKELRERETARIKREVEEKMDPMRAVENKTMDSMREIMIADALESIKAIKDDLERVNPEDILPSSSTTSKANKKQDEEEVDRQVAEAFKKKHEEKSIANNYLKIEDDDKDPLGSLPAPLIVTSKRPNRMADLQTSLGIRFKKAP